MHKRLFFVGMAFLVVGAMLITNLTIHINSTDLAEAGLRQRQTVLTAGHAEGTIYDCHLSPLVNQKTIYYAAASPTQEAIAELLVHTKEMSSVLEGLRTGKPFLCRVDTDTFTSKDITVLSVPERRQGTLTAQHVIGYTLEGTGMTGLESDYDRILRGTADTASAVYTVDAQGRALLGESPVVSEITEKNPGLVTTLDADIQQLCEAQSIEKGAIVVMDVESGDVLAMASFPSYDPDALGEALESPDSPLINRCICAYNVGSIFKLMTCAAAYKQKYTDFETECTGKTQIKNQTFRCHDWRGHGIVDMKHAMIYSCNTYFVELSQYLDPAIMRETAQDFGFGTQIALTTSIVSASGTLPSLNDLSLPAEMANFCFGQGLLTATPLQVAQMTCGIANDGSMPLARLIKGYTTDSETVTDEKAPVYAHSLPRNAAYYLQDMMISAINESDTSNAVPENVYAAAKTSTAQTGRYDPDGTEYCHAWITGYFPMEEPKYAVTVLVEDGGYGNDAAAPVFKAIADALFPAA